MQTRRHAQAPALPRQHPPWARHQSRRCAAASAPLRPWLRCDLRPRHGKRTSQCNRTPPVNQLPGATLAQTPPASWRSTPLTVGLHHQHSHAQFRKVDGFQHIQLPSLDVQAPKVDFVDAIPAGGMQQSKASKCDRQACRARQQCRRALLGPPKTPGGPPVSRVQQGQQRHARDHREGGRVLVRVKDLRRGRGVDNVSTAADRRLLAAALAGALPASRAMQYIAHLNESRRLQTKTRSRQSDHSRGRKGQILVRWWQRSAPLPEPASSPAPTMNS